jgi:molybdopterin molybdotransferase
LFYQLAFTNTDESRNALHYSDVNQPFATMLSPDEARLRVLQAVSILPAETIDQAEALGRTLAQDVISPINLPPFDNSAMDGYAVMAQDVAGASEENPVSLRLLDTVGAGEVSSQTVQSGTCLKIMTGAPLPAGADAVVMREETRVQENTVTFLTFAHVGEHIRRAGSDLATGEKALQRGTEVKAAQWAMLAALGCAQVEVFRRPRVGIVSTGKELVEIEAPLLPGQIRDSNAWALRGLSEAAGAEVVAVRRVGDSLEEVRDALSELATLCDVVVTSGGVSMGDFDPVRDVLQAEARIHFWKVAMKPGKPLMFASWGQTLVFGLPGNPASAMVSFEAFVRPALLKMGGRRALRRPTVLARLQEPLQRLAGRIEFVRATVSWQGDGFAAKISGDQGSGRLSTMTNANALLVIDAETTSLPAGSMVQARLLEFPEVEEI